LIEESMGDDGLILILSDLLGDADAAEIMQAEIDANATD
jgi:hypothetical protein